MKELSDFVEFNKNKLAELETNAINEIAKLPLEQQKVLMECLGKAKRGEITKEELINISKQWV